MKNLFLFSAFALLTFSPYASAKSSPLTADSFQSTDTETECEKFSTRAECVQDYFSQLESMFKTGTLPTTESVTGWFSGRCYTKDNKSSPRNVLLIGWSEGDNGPLFPGQVVYKGFWMWNRVGGPNHYDDLTPEKESETQTFWLAHKEFAQDAKVEGCSLVARYGSAKWNMRQAGDYLTMEHFETGQGQAYAYCYLAKKVK